jgi:hypothetical protein
MMDLSESQKKAIASYKRRLAAVERGDVWCNGHPGPYTAKEKADEIARFEALIAKVEAGEK